MADAPKADGAARGDAAPPGALSVGISPPMHWMRQDAAQRARWLRAVDAVGIDHVGLGDHVSFRGQPGMDGVVNAASVLAAAPQLRVVVGVYQLLLRHPVTVARSLSTLAELGPGRLVFGVGVAGEDPLELANCGVAVADRGRRMDESMAVVRSLLTGAEVDFEGRYVSIRDCVIRPAPSPQIPILVGGRSSAALQRAGRYGDGWLGIWVSPQRYAAAVAEVQASAAEAGRVGVAWTNSINVWCGIGSKTTEAREILAREMEDGYGISFERFSRWCPCGPPEAIAEFLDPYVEAGCSNFTLVARSEPEGDVIEQVASVRELLQAQRSVVTGAPSSGRGPMAVEPGVEALASAVAPLPNGSGPRIGGRE